MNLQLERRLYRSDGIFSDLKDGDGNVLVVTLEHAYQLADGRFVPKLSNGTFLCQKGPHRLHGMTADFITYEVANVPQHSGILFHWGNYNKDSDGCILVGQTVAFVNGMKMITRSRESFGTFMIAIQGLDSFQLTVIG